MTAKEDVFQFFREDVEEFLRSEEIPLFRDVKLSGKSGLDHHFDIGLPPDARHPEPARPAALVGQASGTLYYFGRPC